MHVIMLTHLMMKYVYVYDVQQDESKSIRYEWISYNSDTICLDFSQNNINELHFSVPNFIS